MEGIKYAIVIRMRFSQSKRIFPELFNTEEEAVDHILKIQTKYNYYYVAELTIKQ